MGAGIYKKVRVYKVVKYYSNSQEMARLVAKKFNSGEFGANS